MKNKVPDAQTDVVIVWGWIVGSTLHHMLWYVQWDISSILIERQKQVGELNSEYTQNSQTLHEGDIESNYKDIQKIRTVHAAAWMFKSFLLDQWHDTSHLYTKVGKMLLGVNKKEVVIVSQRYNWLTENEKIFPNNKLLDRDQLSQLEPALVDGRDAKTPVVAYYNPDGYAVDFGAACQTLVDVTTQTRGDLGQVILGNGVKEIIRADNSWQLFDVELEDGKIIRTKAVVVSAGGFTPVLMKQMWYRENIGILSIAGNYYRIKPSAKHKITNKVYTVQVDGLPFAALHADPEVSDPEVVRLWPTAFGIPFLEKKKRTSFFDYMGIINARHDLGSFINIMSNEIVRKYVFKNYKFFIPIYGKWLFLKEARKIIPTLNYSDIELFNGYGGTRPQMIDRTTHALNFGEAKIFGKNENLIFNITPSPGASTAFGNAYNDVQSVLQMPGFKHYKFDKSEYEKNFWKVIY